MRPVLITLFFLAAMTIVSGKHHHKKQKKSEQHELPSCYRKKKNPMTMYWIPKEGDKDMTNDGKTVQLVGKKTKKLKTAKGKTIAKVADITYKKFQMEGTGILLNGVMVNLDQGDNTFLKVSRKKRPYGLGDNDVALQPWVSIASNDIKQGTTVYVKDLDGIKLPDGKVHNGCLRVDDQGWSFGKCQIDFFTLQFTAYQALDKKLPSKVKIVQKNCKVLNYVTTAVKKWAVL